MFFNFNKDAKEAQVDKANLKMTVVKSRCPQNHRCPAIRVCPVDAITQKGYDAPKIDQEKCIKCGKCVKFCPMGALKFQ